MRRWEIAGLVSMAVLASGMFWTSATLHVGHELVASIVFVTGEQSWYAALAATESWYYRGTYPLFGIAILLTMGVLIWLIGRWWQIEKD